MDPVPGHENSADDPSEGVRFEAVESYDSRLFIFVFSLLCFVLLAFSTLAWGWGLLGFIWFGTSAVWSLVRLAFRRVRLRIDEEGVVDRFVWFSPGIIPWRQIIEVRPTRWGLIQVDLRDNAAFYEQLSPLAELQVAKLRLWGLGPAVLRPWSLEASRSRLLQVIEDGMDAYALSELKREKALGPGESQQPTEELPWNR
jgi:hypothetical protein